VIERAEPEIAVDERATLEQFLDYFRATLLIKVDGLDTETSRRQACPPSTLNLLGLVRHMAAVERHWFRRTLLAEDVPQLFFTDDDPELDMQPPPEATLEEAIAAFNTEMDAARRAVADLALDDLALAPRYDGHPSLRWIMVHMIEEYARHAGHADLLREAIDGSTGD